MFAVGVNSSAKDLIETIKRPDAIAAGYIGQFVKLVTVDDPFITTDYMVCPSICCFGRINGLVARVPSRNVGKIDEASELRRTVSDIKHNVQTQLSENAKTNKRVTGIRKELQKLHREAIQNTINSVTMVATLIASIAFVVIFNLPGQYFQDVNSGGDIDCE
ncbi:ankyrin repeat-containing protein At2g01680 [Zea mays]|uniref:ankyrin repeat-containing protein At2g01680 n=1 Tax=Zea mays TaxID=4577 RepID=UPI0009AAB3CC|nr:ankyrin repeat-containing protein At2g01680 [Zea mays]|eukprot:XP_020406314.1 ankyrin repeat-containing protein At2g01680 [Zea mays]